MPPREAWGLDIGQTALHAVKLRRLKGDACEIEDVYFHDLDTHLDDPEYDDKVVAALLEFVAEKKVGKTPVVVSLPGFTTLFRDFPLPAVGGSRLEEIVSYEAKQLIPYPLEAVIWDYHQLREDEETGEISIALVCCRRDIVDDILGILDEASLNIEALQVGPVALVNYIQYECPPDEAALILDTGARGTDFVIVNDGAFWLRSVGVSGTDLTKVLMNKFSIPYDKAEELKFEVGDSKQGDRVFRVMEPVLRNLCGEVQRSVGYYKSLFRGVTLSEIICAGNTYLLAGVDQFLADNTGLPARTLDVPQEVGINFTVDEGEVEAHRQVLGTATGLALQGIGLSEINTTLLPRERRMAKLMQSKLKWAAMAVGVAALTVAINFFAAGSNAAQYEDLIKKTGQSASLVGSKKSEFNEVTAKFPREVERIRQLANVTMTRGYLRDAFASVLQPVEQLNANREGLVRSKIETEFPRMLQEYHEKLDILPPAPDAKDTVKEQYEKLRRRVEERVKWQYARQGLVVVQDMTFDIVQAQRSTQAQPGGGVKEWWSLPSAGAAAAPDSPATGFGGAPVQQDEPVDVVKIKLSGYVVTALPARVVTLQERLGELQGVLPFKAANAAPNAKPVPVEFTYRTGTRQNVKVPAVRLPAIIEKSPTTAGPGAEPAAGVRSAPASSASGVSFETAQEVTATFEATLHFLPRFHQETAAPASPAAQPEEE